MNHDIVINVLLKNIKYQTCVYWEEIIGNNIDVTAAGGVLTDLGDYAVFIWDFDP